MTISLFGYDFLLNFVWKSSTNSFRRCSVEFAETVKVIPQHLVTYKVFGKPEGPHYAHYDLVGGRKVRAHFLYLKVEVQSLILTVLSAIVQAVHEVYPCIIEFLSQHDEVSS